MVSSTLCMGLIVAAALMLASYTECAPATKLEKAKFNHAKRAFIHPVMDDVNRCIMACGMCADDLDTPDDKVFAIYSFIYFKKRAYFEIM